MSIIGDGIMLGAGGESASIFVTGLSETDSVTATKDGKTIAGKWSKGHNPNYIGLPDGYTQLKYIQSTGSQYVNTGITPNSNYSVKMRVRNSSPTGSYCLFGTDTTWLNNGFSVHTATGEWGSTELEHTIIETTNFHDIELKAGTVYLDGSSVGSVTNSAFSCSYNLVLFALNRADTIREYTELELCSCEIRNADELVRNYIPCKRNSDNVIGLYDLVNDIFYTNAGTGTFTAGAKIPSYVYGFEIAPIKSYGTWTVSNADSTKTADVLIDAAAEFEVTL